MIARTTSTDTTKRNSHRQSLLSMTPSLARTLAKIYGGRPAFPYRPQRLSSSPHFFRRAAPPHEAPRGTNDRQNKAAQPRHNAPGAAAPRDTPFRPTVH